MRNATCASSYGRISLGSHLTRPPFGWLTGVLLVVGGLITQDPAHGQRNTFDPSLNLRYIYRSNVNFVSVEEESDSSLRVALRFPLDRTLKKGSMNFSYAVYGEYFDARQELDNIGHRLSFGVSTQPTRTSALNFSLAYSRTQDQGGPFLDINDEVDDPTFTRRLQRDRATVRFGYDVALSQRWYAGIDLGASGWAFENPSDDSEDTLVSRDRIEMRAYGRVGRILSPSLKAGLVLGFYRFDLDFSGITDSVSAAFEIQKEVSDTLNWAFRLGAYRSERDEQISEIDDATNTGWQGRFSLTKNQRKVNLYLLASHGLSAGGFRFGTSVNSRLYFSVIDSYHRTWGWGVFLRAGRRDPNLDIESQITTYEAGGGIQKAVARVLGLSFTGSYVAQDNEMVSSSRSFYRVSASLSWHPLGWKKFASWRNF